MEDALQIGKGDSREKGHTEKGDTTEKRHVEKGGLQRKDIWKREVCGKTTYTKGGSTAHRTEKCAE